MAVRPSCPVLVIHEDDAFRKALIASLDRKHFTVTFTTDGEDALRQLDGAFAVIILSVDLRTGHGMKELQFLRDRRDTIRAKVIILGEPSPELRAHAGVAAETLLKPVDPEYVADRARTYCG